MSLSLAFRNALSGLQAAQGSLAVISSNVSNANTVGYTRKQLALTPATVGGQSLGVQSGAVLRQVDELMRRDLRREMSNLGSADVRNAILGRVQDLLGNTNDGGFIAWKLSAFAAAMDAYATSPELAVNQGNVIAAASALTTALNRSAADLQALRGETAQGIGVAVDEVNASLNEVARLNKAILRAAALGQPTGDLADQRDRAATAIAEQMDVQTCLRPGGEMVIYTASGRPLVDGVARTLSYDTPSSFGSSAALPPITLGPPPVDITGELKDGRITAMIEAVQTTLPGVAAQLDGIAQALYGSLDRSTGVTDAGLVEMEVSATAGSFASGDIVTAGAKEGVVTGVIDLGNGQLRLTIRPTAGSLAAGDTIANGLGAAGDIDAVDQHLALGALATGSDPGAQRYLELRGLTTTPTVGQTISDGATTATITGVTYDAATGAARVAISITSGPGFVLTVPPSPIGFGGAPAPGAVQEVLGINDSGRLFAGAGLTSSAATITVHPDLVADLGGDPGLLDLAGLAQRLADSLKARLDFGAAGGLPGTTTTIAGYAAMVVAGNAVATAKAEAGFAFQSQYQQTLEMRAAEVEGVDLDEEMANMTIFQNAYGASAKVMDAVSQMMDVLLSLKG